MHEHNFIIEVYCIVEEELKKIQCGSKLRTKGYSPKLSDEEVLTMEIAGEYLRLSKDKQIWSYFKTHYKTWFPNIGTRETFIRQSANLHELKRVIHKELIQSTKSCDENMYIADSFPIPPHIKSRAYSGRNFKKEADYGYCASKDLHYYGFKGMFIINSQGVVVDLDIAPANTDDRAILKGFSMSNCILLGDKGFLCKELKQDLQDYNVNLLTPSRKNAKKPNILPEWFYKTRRRIETVIGQFTDRFSIQKHGAKDLWHLMSRIYRKVLSHTICIIINRKIGNNLDISNIITDF
jgi:hypothetical protein